MSKKLQAANILKQCEFNFKKASIDGLKNDSLHFSVFLNAHNKGSDSLYAQRLTGMLYLDSLFEIPISLQNQLWLSPGDNQLAFSGAIEFNVSKILSFPELLVSLYNLQKFTVKGNALIALKPGQDAIEIEFKETKDIPPDLIETQIKNFMQDLIESQIKNFLGL